MLAVKYFGQTIPKGYMVEIKSWENDGDDCRDKILTGLSKKDVDFLTLFLEEFRPSCSNSGYGNDEINDGMIASALLQYAHTYKDQVKKFFHVDLTHINEDEDVEWDELESDDTELYEHLCELLSYPVQYDYGFCRVFDGIRVYLIEDDIHIPSIKRV